ncbi:hypothetical protein [Halonatronum saccharophilum]|uniref:hypothetical protein n=1 Tax=Halonatronum saccharophilum TaxID=150060 RepID=UPI000487F621|nr:hypothetical protein [Halonatronum saccharophilum]
MNLLEYLERSDKKNLSLISNKHNICFDPKFSKRWISKKISQKLLNPNYLDYIINENLSSKSKDLIKRLTLTQSINKNSLDQEVYEELRKTGLIYEDKEFCHLPWDLRNILSKKFKGKEKKSLPFTKKVKKINLSTQNKRATIKVPFSTYLVLSFAYLDRLNESNKKARKIMLLDYLKDINQSEISSEQLLNCILYYSNKKSLLSENLMLNDSFKKWLTKKDQEIIFDLLEVFFPKKYLQLKKVIAVLLYYPPGKSIPLSFLNKEFGILFAKKEGKMIHMLNIIDISKDELALNNFIWHLFNKKIDSYSKPLQILKNEVLIDPEIRIKTLWTIAKYSTLTDINNQLKFKVNERSFQMSQNLEKKYPSLKELRLKRIKGEYQSMSDDNWKNLLNQFKLEHNIEGNESLRIDLAYRSLPHTLN